MCTENYMQDCHDKCSTQLEDSFYQQIWLTCEGKTSKVLHLVRRFVWCWKLGTSKSGSEISERFEIWCWGRVVIIGPIVWEMKKYFME